MTHSAIRRADTLPRRIRGVIRTTRKTLRSLPARFRNARTALVMNAPPSALTIDRVGPFRVAYRQGTADEGVLKESFERDIFFSGVPEYQPRPTDTIIDVGAHIGTFSLLAASKVPQGRVFAIEACRESCHYAELNVGLNNLPNVDVNHLALADFQGTVRLFYNTNSGSWGHTITKAFSRRGEDVPADTLGNFLDQKNIERCDFVKFNCEGAEFQILLSSPREVLQRIDMMLVLYHRDLAAGYHYQELANHLEHCGFATELRNQGRNRGWIVARNRALSTADIPLAKSA